MHTWVNAVRRHGTKLAWVFYAAWTAVFTWPLVLQLKTNLYGQKGDNLGSVWFFWWFRYAGEHKLPWQLATHVAAPFGWRLSEVPLQYPVVFAGGALSRLIGEIAVYNLLILLGFWLSAVAMYLLTYHLTKNRAGAFVAGLAFGFAPYHSAHALAHLHLATMQWLPFCLLALLYLDKKRSLRSGALWGLSLAVVVLDNYYYGYFMTIVIATFFAVRLLWGLAHHQWPFDRRYVLALLAGGIVLTLIIAPIAYPILQQARELGSSPEAQSLGYQRSLGIVYKYSAHPWNYILPSVDHPVWGRYMETFTEAYTSYNVKEHTLYIGYANLGLAIVALLSWRAFASRQRFALILFTAIAIVAFVLSLPPTVSLFNRSWPMPSGFLHSFVPMFRSYARFGGIVSLAITVSAGLGFTIVWKKIHTRRQRLFVLVLICGLILFEFAQKLPARSVGMDEVPDVYAWLAKQPGDFIIAEYPLEINVRSTHYKYLFYQTFHGKRLFNGTVRSTPEDQIRLMLVDLFDPNTPKLLAHLGVRYAVVHENDYAPSVPVTDSPLEDLGLVLVAQSPGVRIYEIKPVPLPDVYAWLAEQPDDFAAVEYPLEFDSGPRYPESLIYQLHHGKKLLNHELWKSVPTEIHHGLTDLSGPDTPAMLAHLGVRYVLLYEDDYIQPDCPPPLLENADGLRLVATSPGTQLYQVQAAPPDSVIALFHSLGCGWSQGFYTIEDQSDDRLERWMDTDAQITLFNPTPNEARVDLSATFKTLNGDKTLQVFLNDAFVQQIHLPANVETLLEMNYLVVPPGPNRLKLVVPEGGQSMDEVLHNDDPHVVSVALHDFAVNPNPWVYSRPEVTYPLSVEFGDQMALVGYDLVEEEKALEPGDTLSIHLYWQALAEMARDYTISVQLLGEEGVGTQLDRQPFEGIYPTSHWRAGEVVADEFTLTIPPQVPSGEYSLIVLVYDLTTMERLPVMSEPSATWTELRRIQIEPAGSSSAPVSPTVSVSPVGRSRQQVFFSPAQSRK